MRNKTTNTAVPKLRFPEFREAGEWNALTLKEISDPVLQKVGKLSLPPVSISAGTGFVLQADKFGRDISGAQYKNYILLRKGELSYNKGNSKTFPQGCVYQLKEFDQVAAPNVFISFRFKQGFVAGFYKGYFDNNFHGEQLQNFITSGARSNGLLNISSKSFFSITLPTPVDIAEQQKIAATLSSLDDLLTAHNAKLAALQAHKRGLMQGLFPTEGETVPKLRFPAFREAGEWEEKTLGEVCKAFSGGTPSTSQKKYYGGDIPFIRSAEIDRERTELFLTEEGLTNSSAKLIGKGDILFALYGANSGDVAISKQHGAINQAILCLRSKDSNVFIFHFLTHRKDWIIRKYLQGGQGNLSGEIVKSIDILFPNLAEQQKIADCLSSLDNRITAQIQQIEALKLHKKGLMQSLFPAAAEPTA